MYQLKKFFSSIAKFFLFIVARWVEIYMRYTLYFTVYIYAERKECWIKKNPKIYNLWIWIWWLWWWWWWWSYKDDGLWLHCCYYCYYCYWWRLSQILILLLHFLIRDYCMRCCFAKAHFVHFSFISPHFRRHFYCPVFIFLTLFLHFYVLVFWLSFFFFISCLVSFAPRSSCWLLFIRHCICFMVVTNGFSLRFYFSNAK